MTEIQGPGWSLKCKVTKEKINDAGKGEAIFSRSQTGKNAIQLAM